MTNGKTSLKRLAAGAGAFALAAAGLLGVSTAAFATEDPTPEGPSVGNIDPEAKGSITVHKCVGNEGKAGDGTEIEPDLPALGGVGFTIYKCDVDLLAVTGPWEDLECASSTQIGVELFTVQMGL